ncbi:DNL zinc finger-domain-containing protein [Camillea tinctor]|nr:DNL zinc finger-domain-containing protein [Camillea tinctor]
MMRSGTAIGILKPILRPLRTPSSPPLSSPLSSPLFPPLLRPFPRLPRTSQPAARRFAHAIPKPPSAPSSNSSDANKRRKLAEPHYQLRFTCVPCSHRSTHVVSKQGYHKGSVLITCPECRNRHIISDHLNIFGERKITVEDLMRERGQLVKRGTLGEDGDIEFWEDGTTTPHNPDSESSSSSPSIGKAEKNGAQEEEQNEKQNEEQREAGEEEAARMRDARDPASHSTNPEPSTGTMPIGGTSTRPSVTHSASSHTVPSTRRQYHPDVVQYIKRVNLYIGNGTKVDERGRRIYEDFKLEPEQEPEPRRDQGIVSPPTFFTYKKINADRAPFTDEQNLRVRAGWRHPVGPLPGGEYPERGPATRIPLEELRKLKYPVAFRRKPQIPDPEETPSEFLCFTKSNAGPGKPRAPPVITSAPVHPKILTQNGTFSSEFQVQFVPSDNRFRSVRMIEQTVPEKPQAMWPQHVPGRDMSEMDKLEAYSRASTDLWGNEDLTKKMRSMIDKFIDRARKSLF